MKTFLSFVRKEFYHIFRDFRTLMILIAIPIILIVLFGFAITTEVKDIRITVVDNAHDQLSQQLVEAFRASSYFVLQGEQTIDEARHSLETSSTDMALVIGDNFAQGLGHGTGASVQLLVDGSEPNQGSTRAGYAQQVIAAWAQSAMQGRGASGSQLTINPVVHMLYNPQGKSEYNFVPGTLGLILMLICAMMTSIAIVREKETGTMEILLASPLKPMTIILAKLIPYFVVGSVDLAIMLTLSKVLLGMPFAGSLPVFLGISLLYVIVALSLGLFISTLVNSQLAAMLLSIVLVIPVLYFSGMAFMIESMPEVFQRVSAIMPARWYVSAARKLMIQGVEAKYVVEETCVLALEAVVLLAVSLASFKKRL